MQRRREDWTVAEYLDAVRRGDSTAARRLDRCAKRLAASKAKALRLPQEDAEEAAQGACLAAFENDGAALLRVGASTPLSVWVAGVLDHHLLDRVKACAVTEAPAPSGRASRRATQRARVAAERTARLQPEGWRRLGELTQSRMHAFRLHLQGLSDSEISARLGISRGATRERIRSAWGQLEAEARSSVRTQVAALLAGGAPPLDPAELEALLALTKGKTYRQIATERSETPEAVRSRLRRALRRGLSRNGTELTGFAPPG